ncbi:response regulator [Occultella kanbiaonis]|uniref:response regulator n=1 Tax=Occultella kanbiaonis TaxID=2675754 RepID=UPI0012B91683|nr:response regulator transcription factor [Occultella kanbiaonis]
MTIRVLIADDHAAIRAGLGLMLGGDPDVEVVGEAADGEVAVRNARTLRPDVVLMDIRMPRMDGIEATRTIVGEGLADVLVLTTFDLDEYVFGALRAGAAGFLLKSTSAAALLDAVRRVAAGEGVVAPEVTRTLLDAFATSRPGGSGSPEQGHTPAGADGGAADTVERAGLTARELEVLGALARGLSNGQISTGLHITEATTKTHVSHLLAKLGCSSRVQAAILAREAGIA